MIEEQIVARLRAWPGLSALVGTRIYPAAAAPQNVQTPYIVYERRDSERVSTFAGDAGLVDLSFMLECFDVTRTGANAVRREVRLALQRWKSPGIVRDSYILSEADGPLDEKTRRFRGDVAVRVWAEDI